MYISHLTKQKCSFKPFLSHVAVASVILHDTHLDFRMIKKVEFSIDLMHVKGIEQGIKKKQKKTTPRI